MASRGVNKVILVGHLGQDPEVRYMPNGGAVANITLATSESWRDKETGEQKEKTEWHRVVLFGKLAEIAGEYLRKGSQVYIEGSLQTRKWTDQAGVEKYTTEIVVNIGGTLQMLGGRSQPANAGQSAQGSWGKPQQPSDARGFSLLGNGETYLGILGLSVTSKEHKELLNVSGCEADITYIRLIDRMSVDPNNGQSAFSHPS